MTLGSFSGNGTFTAPGSVNPTKLFIPQKDAMDGPTKTMAQTLETFINSLNTPSSTPSQDRLNITNGATVTAGSSTGDPIDWRSGSTILDHVGPSISVDPATGNILINDAGVYVCTFEGQYNISGGAYNTPYLDWFTTGSFTGFYVRDGHTGTGPNNITGLILPISYYFPASLGLQFGAGMIGGSCTIGVQLFVQRVS
jgi:hypothetical protein